MPMNGQLLGNQMFERCVPASTRANMSSGEIAAAKKNFIAMGEAIVTHIISNAQITVNPGQAVTTAGSPTTQTGSTVSPGTAKIM